MTIERKVGMGIAGQPSGSVDVAEVFSTDLWDGTYYNGNGATTTINNGIDLAGEGGLVWLKTRVKTGMGALYDTGRGANSVLFSGTTNASGSSSSDVFGSFTSTGFVTGANGTTNGSETASANSGNKFVSWTFRKKEKFFDIVTWTGNGADGRQIAHSLNSAPAMMLVKRTDSPENWAVYHKNANGGDAYLKLDTTAALDNRGELLWGDGTNFIAPTSTVFTIGSFGSLANANGGTYIAYLFADNSSEDADDQMIKCGGYTGTNTNSGPVIDLGWEPQFVMIKSSNGGGNWIMFDTMRGMTVDGTDSFLFANLSNAEDGYSFINVTPTGFKFITNEGQVNGNETYIYMAIRAPMMKKPEAATDVFSVKSYTGNGATQTLDAAFGPVDMAIVKNKESGVGMQPDITTRLTHAELYTDSSTEEGSRNFVTFDSNSLVLPAQNNSNTSNIPFSLFSWKRAKGYMDCVAYSGTGSARTQTHSLGVVPEMIWVKSRANSKNWAVYHPSSHAAGNTLFLNLDNGGSGVGGFQSTAVSDTTFNVDTAEETNSSGWTYVAYLFATLAGISKVGSYTGNGYNQTINCGFSAGARFILIKRIGATGDWYLWDSARGIVAGNDPHFSLNTDAEQITSNDSIDPANSGFIVNQVSATNINVSSGTYIFYAIA